MFRASASRVPSLCWMIWLHVLISLRIGHQIQHRRMHSNDSIYLIAPWVSAYALGWSLQSLSSATLVLLERLHRSKSLWPPGVTEAMQRFVEEFIHNLPSLWTWVKENEDDLDSTKKSSLQHLAATFPHKFKEWQPQGDERIKGFFSIIIAWTPLNWPLILAALSYLCPWQSESGTLTLRRKSQTKWAISAPVYPLSSIKVKNRSWAS